MIAYPQIDPVLFSVGPIAIRWYSLAYIAGLVSGWIIVKRIGTMSKYAIAPALVDDFFVWATVGVVLGGRTGYVLFYNFHYFMANPLEILQVWHGGMSFHGGLMGIIVAIFAFSKKHNLSFPRFADRLAVVTPLGLFFGRIANFINGELWGKPSDVPWAMVFPQADSLPRHPSQIYEALLEGVISFVILVIMLNIKTIREKDGVIGGTFLMLYGLSRFTVEFFRQPDEQVGYLIFHATMGQLLSIPLILLGVITIIVSVKIHTSKKDLI